MSFPPPSEAGAGGKPGGKSAEGLADQSPPTPSGASGPEHLGRILFLDDDRARAETFLSQHPGATWVKTAAECLARLVEPWDEIHLDHDLGGKTFVDMDEEDCGMEVIRWLCKEPRDHLRLTRFYIHTHNSIAGLMMVLQMRSSGFRAEFRPFGLDPDLLLSPEDDESPEDREPPGDAGSCTAAQAALAPMGPVGRLLGRLKRWWPPARGTSR
jgi:hypothetical protein